MWAAASAQTPGDLDAQDAPANPGVILARVKAGLRASERPPFVVYTLIRRELLDNVPDMENSYTLRIWCRTADSAALSRRVWGSHANDPAAFIFPAFDQPLDPGPPTADLLDVIRQTHGSPMRTQASPVPSDSPVPLAGASLPPVIGSVSVFIEHNYHVTFAGTQHGDIHLRLDALRDPERNRLTDLYVDGTTYALHRAVAHDHLYTPERTIPERFEIDFGTQDGVPVIVAIHGETDYAALDVRARGEPFHAVDYRFVALSFPTELPAWYFEPARYGEHRNELPD